MAKNKGQTWTVTRAEIVHDDGMVVAVREQDAGDGLVIGVAAYYAGTTLEQIMDGVRPKPTLNMKVGSAETVAILRAVGYAHDVAALWAAEGVEQAPAVKQAPKDAGRLFTAAEVAAAVAAGKMPTDDDAEQVTLTAEQIRTISRSQKLNSGGRAAEKGVTLNSLDLLGLPMTHANVEAIREAVRNMD